MIPFMERVHKDENGCWNYLGDKNTKGYGRVYRYDPSVKKSRYLMAHRLSYSMHVGPLIDGKLICHKCNNPSCINPDHLYQGTESDNAFDAIAAGTFKVAPMKGTRKTHCIHGHLFDEKNTRVNKGTGARTCNACALAWYHKNKCAALRLLDGKG